MSSDTSNSGIMQKADQIAFHFYTKLFYTVNQARATEEAHSQGKIDKWFNLETPDSDLFTRDAREPYRNISLSSPSGPPPLEIQVLLSIPELTNNQVLIHRSDDSTNTTTTTSTTQQPPTTGGSPTTQLRIEPTPQSIVLETWTLTFVPHGSSSRLGDQALPTIYKHGIPLFRSLYSLLRVLPVWKLHKRLKRRTGNRNGHLGIMLRVRPLEETDELSGALGILPFGTPPSPSHPALQTELHTFSPLPHPLGSLNISVTYLSSPNFELDELESHLSSRFISLDLQEFVPTLSKHAAREEKEDGSTASGSSGVVGPGVGGARSPPRAIVGATGGGRGGHGHARGLGLGLPSTAGFGESTSMERTAATTSTNSNDNASVAERFIIPSRVPSLGLGVTSSSSSSALIPPPRPQYALPLPLPFPTATSSSSVPSSGASGLALHRMRRESSNSPSSIAAAATTGTGTGVGGSPSSEIFSSSISPHRTSQSPHPPYPYPSSSLSSSPMSGAGIGAVPIRRPTAVGGGSGGGGSFGSGIINPFKGNTLSSASASASGSSPSLSIRQGLSLGIGGGGGGGGSGSPLSTAGSFSRVPPSPVGATPSSLGDRKEYRGRISSESDRGEWERDDRERSVGGEGSRERDNNRFRRISAGYSIAPGLRSPTPIERQEDAIGGGGGGGGAARIIPPPPPPTRKRYSSSFGNRYVGSVGSGVGSGVGGESGSSTPASVGTGAMVERKEMLGGGGNGKGREQSASGGVASFLSTATDDDDISNFVQDIDARKPLSGRARESEERERDREREVERGRERDREEEGQDHDRERRQESVRSKGKQREVGLVTSPVSRHRQRSPLSPLSALDREQRGERVLSTTGIASTTTEQMTAASNLQSKALVVVPASASTTTTAPSPSLSVSPPNPAAQLSTSPNRGPMLTNQDEVDERLKRMNETFRRSLEGMGMGGSGGRRRDKEKGKEKEKESERDVTTRRRLSSLFVSPAEGEASSNASDDPNSILVTSPSSIPVPSSSPRSNTDTTTTTTTSSNQRSSALHPHTGLGLGLGRGRGRGGFPGSTSTSTSTSTSASSEAIGGGAGAGGASQGSEEVIGRMDFL